MKLLLCTFLAPGYSLPPYACGALEAYLRDREAEIGVPLSIVTLPFSFDTAAEQAAGQIAGHGPDVVGVSCYVWNYQVTIELLPLLRQSLPNAVIIVGGPHVSRDVAHFPVLGERGVVDFYVTGDGEEALLSILREIAGGAHPPAMAGAEYVAARTGGRPPATWIQGVVQDLDTLPSPYRRNPAFRSSVRQTGIAFVEGSRGCVFSCSFCDQGWRKARMRGLALIERDLTFLRGCGAQRIIFFDPTFNFHRQRTLSLLRFIGRDLPGLSIHAEVKADLLDEDQLAALAALPDTSVEVGLQSADEATLRRIQRPTNLRRLRDNVAALASRGVTVYINTIIGLPGETLAGWLRTVDFCYGLGDVVITASALKILPNTDLFAQRRTFAYEYDEDNLCQIVEHDSFSPADLRLAGRASGLLEELQAHPQPDRAALRAFISAHHDGSLAGFLLASVAAGGRTARAAGGVA